MNQKGVHGVGMRMPLRGRVREFQWLMTEFYEHTCVNLGRRSKKPETGEALAGPERRHTIPSASGRIKCARRRERERGWESEGKGRGEEESRVGG